MARSTSPHNRIVTIAWGVAITVIIAVIISLAPRGKEEDAGDYIDQFTQTAWKINEESTRLDFLYDNPKPNDRQWRDDVEVSINELGNHYWSFIKNTPSQNFEYPVLARIKTNLEATCGKLLQEYEVHYDGMIYSDSQLAKLRQLNQDCGGYAVLSIAELDAPAKTYLELEKLDE